MNNGGDAAEQVVTGIGRETIRELTKQPEAKQFTLKIGKRTLIKRKQFEEYLDQICYFIFADKEAVVLYC